MDRADEIFLLFEGGCPSEGCEAPQQVIEAGGTKQFRAMQSWVFNLPIELKMWDENGARKDVIGSIEFSCIHNHQYTVEYGQWGEWL